MPANPGQPTILSSQPVISPPAQTTPAPPPPQTTPAPPAGGVVIVISISLPAAAAASPAASSASAAPLAGFQAGPLVSNVTYNGKRQAPLSPIDLEAGYISATGMTGVCAAANSYSFSNGQLLDVVSGILVSANVDLSPSNLNNPGAKSISTTFVIENGILLWRNPAFYNGAAVFCLLNSVVYAIFDRTGPPAGCTTIVLVAISGLSIHCLRQDQLMLTHPPLPS